MRPTYQAENEAVLDARALQYLSELLKACLEGVENGGRGASGMIHKVARLLMMAYTRRPYDRLDRICEVCKNELKAKIALPVGAYEEEVLASGLSL
jgi:hypothetical protein